VSAGGRCFVVFGVRFFVPTRVLQDRKNTGKTRAKLLDDLPPSAYSKGQNSLAPESR